MITTIFDAMIQSDRRGRGAAGETLAQDLLCRAGYEVRKYPPKSKRGDLQVIEINTGEVWAVEVKTAKRRSDGKWCFQLLNKSQDYRHADYVLLVAVLSGGKTAEYLIPVSALERHGLKCLTISNVNSGKWTDYRVKGLVSL